MSQSSSKSLPTMRVRLLKNGKVIRSFVVKKDTFTIGSGKESAVRIGGIPDLAPKHALIWLDDAIPTLVPSSGAVVFVNGQQTTYAQLNSTDIVTLGKLDLQIESLVTGAPTEPPPPNDCAGTVPAMPPVSSAPVAPPPRRVPPPKTPTPPVKAAPPRHQVNPAVIDFTTDEDETRTAVPAASEQPLSPLPSSSLPSSSPQPISAQLLPDNYFGEDEKTLPASKAYSPLDILQEYDSQQQVISSSEEQLASADFLVYDSLDRSDYLMPPLEPEMEPKGATPLPEDLSWSEPGRAQPSEPLNPFESTNIPREEQYSSPDPLLPGMEGGYTPYAAVPVGPMPGSDLIPGENEGLNARGSPFFDSEIPTEHDRFPPATASPYGALDDNFDYDNFGDFYDDDFYDDDEDDEYDYVEPFSLIDHIARQTVTTSRQKNTERFAAAQVVRFSDGYVWDVVLVNPGQSYSPGPGIPKLLRMKRRGKCLIAVPAQTQGTVWIGGIESSLDTQLQGLSKRKKLVLGLGDKALLRTEFTEHFVQILRPPKKSKPSFLATLMSTVWLGGFTLGIATFLVLTIFTWSELIGPPQPPPEDVEEHFEEISVNDLALIAAQIEDVVEVEEEEPEVEEQDAQQPIQEEEPRRTPRTRRRQSRASGSGGSSAASRLLNALKTGGSSSSGASLQDVITNIDAVGSSSAASGLFRTTGLFSSLPGGKVQIARRGGGSGVNTVGGGELAKSSPGLGAVQGSGGKRGKVRGRVSRVSSQARVRGNLDRGEVLRVINSRMGAITRCYERRLLSNPNLSGRLVFGWTIGTNGRVGGVSVRSSSIADPAVASCISGVIQGMRFPRPDGGSVSISFPFLFRAVDY